MRFEYLKSSNNEIFDEMRFQIETKSIFPYLTSALFQTYKTSKKVPSKTLSAIFWCARTLRGETHNT